MKITTMMIAATLLVSTGAQAGFVTIGDPGNAADANGKGAVDYIYRIGEHEVTIAEFAASGAGNGNENDWEITVGTNAPVSKASFYEMAKYCNWLTSGTTNKGAYSFDYKGSFKGVNRASALATYGTVYAVPNTNEWYKAAYYNTVAHSYSHYANGTDTAPSGTDANYNNTGGTPWIVGSGTMEQNGTYDMAGNVWELMEFPAGRYFGGFYAGGAYQLLSSYAGQAWGSGQENASVGFRIVEVVADPESIGWVTIGDPGNPADTNGIGSVDYTYDIGVHEVTIAEFAASGAGNGNENAWESTVGTNTVPAVNLSFYESAKYCNWLTSGNTNNGAYLFDGNGVYLGVDRSAAIALYGTIYAIPTTDEWHKAAYYDVATQSYTRYANGTESAPTGFSARYGRTSGSPDYHPWVVGSGLVAEQNGTRDMAGNVWERVEDDDRIYSGSYAGGVHQLRSEYAGIAWNQWTENTSVGLRVVRITPPSSAHYPSTILSLSHEAGDVYKMVVACPTPETSYPKIKTDLVIGSWESIGHSTNSGGPFTTNNLGSVAGTNTIYIESSTSKAFFGIGEQ